MSYASISLPAPAANGSGAAVDASGLGAEKTITVKSNGATVLVEVSNQETPTKWAPLVSFLSSGSEVVSVAAHWMRATVMSYDGGAAPTVEVGALDIEGSFVELVAPAGNGAGAGVDTSAMPLFKTVHVGGAFEGALLVEVSEDGGATYQTRIAFTPQLGGIQSSSFSADLMRVSRNGCPTSGAGTPLVWVGATSDDVGGGSSSTVQVDNTLEGDGTSENPIGVKYKQTYFDTFVNLAGVLDRSTDPAGFNFGSDIDGHAGDAATTVGLIGMATGPQANNNGKAAFSLTDGNWPYMLGKGVFTMTWRVALELLPSAASTSFDFFFGAIPGTSGSQGPGLHFYCSEKRMGTRTWWACVDNAALGPPKAVNTNVLVDQDVLHTFKIVYDSTAVTPNAKYYIDGVLVATITANLPADVPVMLAAVMAYASNDTFRVDYVETIYDLTVP